MCVLCVIFIYASLLHGGNTSSPFLQVLGKMYYTVTVCSHPLYSSTSEPPPKGNSGPADLTLSTVPFLWPFAALNAHHFCWSGTPTSPLLLLFLCLWDGLLLCSPGCPQSPNDFPGPGSQCWGYRRESLHLAMSLCSLRICIVILCRRKSWPRFPPSHRRAPCAV